MTNPLFDRTSPEYRALALDAICVCLRHESESWMLEIDLESEAYAAIDALVAGKTLSEALMHVSSEHSFAWKMHDELRKVAEKLGSDEGEVTPLDASQLPFAVEVLGVNLFDLCERFAGTSENLGIDLWGPTYEALTVLAEGGALDTAQALIPTRHPGADKIQTDLKLAAGHVAAVTALVARNAKSIERFYDLRQQRPEMEMRPLALAMRDILQGASADEGTVFHYDWRESSGWLELQE